MFKKINGNFRFSAGCIVVILGMMMCANAAAWTRARLTDVDVVLHISPSGESEYETNARFEVSAGYFHGFDLAPQSDSELVPEKCYARIEGGLRMHVKVKKLFDGRQRVVLANRDSVHDGAVVFTLVHRTSLQSTGALANHNGRARLDWSPIVWDHGTDAMSVSVILPGQSRVIEFNNDVMRDYELETRTADEVKFKKYRTVKWYSMQVIMEFDVSLVKLENTPPSATANLEIPIARNGSSERLSAGRIQTDVSLPLSVRLIPVFVSLLGLLLLLWKVRGVQKAHWDVGTAVQFKLLRNTTFLQRLMLSIIAILLGLAAQMAGSVAASVPALAAAASLWLMNREGTELLMPTGGKWRPMSDEDVSCLKTVHTSYCRRRTLALDISTPIGAMLFLTVIALGGYGIFRLHISWPQVAFASTISALIWILPIWFSFFRSELPADPTIESFGVLKRWQKGISRLVGKLVPDAKVQYWLREDDTGPMEVRLRVRLMSGELNSLEIGTEIVRSKTTFRARRVAVFKVAPGTETARKLAACPNALEHHLTPDLEQEVIVIRNRRGHRDMGVTPLRHALSLLQS